MSNLKRQGFITEWHDRNISAGTDWVHETDTHLNTADIILLLISPDFIESDYCYSVEMIRAIERHKAGEARVIPIILRPTDWTETPFSKLQVLPVNAKPVTRWQDRDQAFLEIAEGIRTIIQELRFKSSSKPKLFSPIYNVPHRRNVFFTDREDILKQLHDNFTSMKPSSLLDAQAISGLGGIGKTQIAIEYSYRYRNEYEAILWVRAATRDTLASDFVTIAKLLQLPERNEQNQNVVLKAVKQWLEEHSKWLLIVDNADDLVMIDTFLPDNEGTNGDILLTTRAQAAGNIAYPITVEKMTREDGSLLLLKRARIPTSNASLNLVSEEDRYLAGAIVLAMDGLPLALDQAGAYIEETGSSLAEYLKLYQTRRKELLQLRGALSSDHPEPVATTWSLSFQQAEKASQEGCQPFLLASLL